MKKKILDALKTRYNNLGFGDKAFNGVASFLEKTVTDEDQIETAIGGVKELLTAFQSDADKVRAENMTLKEVIEKMQENKGGEPAKKDEPTPPAGGANNADLAKLIADAIKPFADKIAGLEAGKVADTRKQQLDAVISNASEKYKARISKYYGRMTWKDDEDYNAWLEEIRAEAETDATDTKATGAAFGIPFAGGKQSANKAIEQDIKDWAARNKPQNN